MNSVISWDGKIQLFNLPFHFDLTGQLYLGGGGEQLWRCELFPPRSPAEHTSVPSSRDQTWAGLNSNKHLALAQSNLNAVPPVK